MKIYAIALFFHLVGVIGMFVGMGSLLLAMAALRRAERVQQVRAIIEPLTAGRRFRSEPVSVIDGLVIGSVLVTAATGLYMALTVWGLGRGWILTAIVSFAAIAPVGPFVVNPRLHAIAREAGRGDADTPIPSSLRLRIHDPVLGTALQTLPAWMVGLVFLMTNKPSLAGSVTVMATSLLAGLASGVPLMARRRGEPTDRRT